MLDFTLVPSQTLKIGNEPVVVLPLKKWKEIENILEDWQMYNSEKLRRDIAKARKEVRNGETLTLSEVEKKLSIKK